MTDTTEHLHTDVKDAYQASNWQEWKEQTVRWLTWHERICNFEAWMEWCKAEEQKEFKQSSLESEQTQSPEAKTDASSNSNSSCDAQTLVVDGGSKRDEEEWAEESNGDDYKDLDVYGERLEDRDEDGEWEDIGQGEAEAWADIISSSNQ